jgi:DNA-binding protein HU-beta
MGGKPPSLGLTGPTLWALFPPRRPAEGLKSRMRRCKRPGTRSSLWRKYKDATMSKKDLIEAVAAATELPKDKAGVAVDAVIAHIEGSMRKGEEVRIPGFGTFKVSERKARKARNPQTGVEMMLKASRVPKFQASKTLKELLN